MRKWVAGAFFGLTSIVALPAHAEGLQIQCGAEEGMGYATARGDAQAEWYPDKTTNGQTLIRVKDNGGVEVLFVDALKVWRSAKDDGASIEFHNLTRSPKGMTALVVYPEATIEILMVTDIKDDKATLIHTVARNMDLLTNARISIASCEVTHF